MDQSVQKALKKAKRRQWLKMIVISFIACIVLFLAFYRTGNYFAAKSTQRLHERLFLDNAIMQPNVQIDSQVTANRSMFGGNIITNRSKDIDGYVVPWSTLTSSYGWVNIDLPTNDLVPGYHSDAKNSYEYDKQTKQKWATFYNPLIKNYYDGVQNELTDVIQLKNRVAEVAISFKEPMTMKELDASIPDNLNVVWLYMFSRVTDESLGPIGVPVYGIGGSKIDDEGLNSFIEALNQYDKHKNMEEIQKFIKENEGKRADEVKVLGVMLTGQTQNFETLIDEDFVRGASVGVTVEMVPYITPLK